MNQIIKLKEEWKCEVCGKCVLSCKRDAISFSLGTINYFPIIDEDKCIKCNKCVESCEKLISLSDEMDNVENYICESNDPEIVTYSSSGGVFSEIANYVLENGGIVLGASYNSQKQQVEHVPIFCKDELKLCRKSKYFQSNPSAIYSVLKEYGPTGRTILVTGTPCQVAPIKEFVECGENVICVDLYCHGVMNAGVSSEYLRQFGVSEIDFRGEGEKGNFYLSVKNNGKETYKCWCYEDSLYRSFIYGVNFKYSCFDCRYAYNRHVSDITLGDWSFKSEGFGKHPSIVTINSKSGKELFENIKTKLKVKRIINEKKVKDNYYCSHSNREGEWGYNIESAEHFIENCKTLGVVRALEHD